MHNITHLILVPQIQCFGFLLWGEQGVISVILGDTKGLLLAQCSAIILGGA